MSIHSSLKVSGKLAGSRNVWTRAERLTVLKREGRWTDDDSVLGLPKVRTRFKVKTKKQIKAEHAAQTPEGAPAESAAEPKSES
jgi:small basic protein (TIGR04137 family)